MMTESECERLVRLNEAALDALYDWYERNPEPRNKYELRRGKDKLGRAGGWYVRTKDYAAYRRALSRELRRVNRAERRMEANPEYQRQQAQWRRQWREKRS